MKQLAIMVRAILAPRYVPLDVTGFAIVFLPRTGSNFLASMLDSHPAILCHHEVFNEDSVHRSLRYKGTSLSFGTAVERDRDPWAFLARVYAFADGARAVGFKISPRQNDYALLGLLLNRKIRKVILGRRGWLHAYTSALIAERTQVWSQHRGKADATTKPASAPVKVRVDPISFRRFVRKRRFFYTLCRVLLTLTGQRAVFMDYEEIGDPSTMRRVLTFLGVDPEQPLAAATDKQNSAHLRDRIENYDELERLLRNTPDAALLDG